MPKIPSYKWGAGRCVVKISNVSRKKNVKKACAKCLVNGGGDAVNMVGLGNKRE